MSAKVADTIGMRGLLFSLPFVIANNFPALEEPVSPLELAPIPKPKTRWTLVYKKDPFNKLTTEIDSIYRKTEKPSYGLVIVGRNGNKSLPILRTPYKSATKPYNLRQNQGRQDLLLRGE